MSKFTNKNYMGLFSLGILIVFITLNTLIRICTNNYSFDMTDNQYYSLSKFSKNQAQKLKQALFINIYYSPEIASENPLYGKYADLVIRFLKQYKKENPNKIFITIKDPSLYPDVAKEAEDNKLTPITLENTPNPLYFGVVFQDSEGKKQVIPNFSPDRDFWLERDISIILAHFNNPQRRIVGIISPIHKVIKKEYSQQAENYAFIDELFTRYDIIELSQFIEEIPSQIDTLVVITPQKMSNSLRYALDQYVLRGGKLIMLLDNLIEDPYYKTTQETINNINQLLNNWGLEFDNNLLASQSYGKKMFMGEGREYRYAPYPLWIDLSSSLINQDVIFSRGFHYISFRSPSAIKIHNTSDSIKLTPLITIDKGGLYPSSEYVFDKNNLTKKYREEQQQYHIAYMSEGRYQTLFPERPYMATELQYNHLIFSVENGKILVIGDSDFIRDDVWLYEEKLSDNGQYLLRAIEYLNGNEEIIDLYTSQRGTKNKSLGENIYDSVYNRHSLDITNLQNELQNLQKELDGYLNNIKNGGILLNAQLSQRINVIRKRIQDIENDLQHHFYKIKQSIADKTQSIIVVNSVVFPLIIVLIWILSAIDCFIL